MKFFLFGAALFLFGSFFSRPARTEETIVLIGGSTDGYLSPCGCTKPMSGGIRRRVKMMAALAKTGRSVVLENGGLVTGTGRQDQMKAETMAESLKAAGVAAINLTSTEGALGMPMVESLQRLSGGAFISGSVRTADATIPATRVAGPFLIGAATPKADLLAVSLDGQSNPADRTVSELVMEAKSKELAPVLLFDGDQHAARELATRHPELALIVFRSTGDPPGKAEVVGSTYLVTPGEHGKHVIRLTYGKSFGNYSAIKLGPDVDDDPTAARAYDRYLGRVTNEKLLDRLPRQPGEPYSSSKRCGTCHQEAYDVWKASGHAHALKTLEDEKHGRDPDCVSCHVVGVEYETGFKDRMKTPDLADVGCESCHGAGEDHSLNPSIKMGKVGGSACMKCHTKENSPNFDFESYWKRVIHN